MIISSDYKSVKATWQQELSRDEVFRRFPDKKGWWIDSSGEVFPAGKDHQKFIKDHPELFDHNEITSTYHAIRKFWVRVSMWGPSFTINSRNISQAQLDAAQNIYMHEGEGKKVEFFQENVIPTSFDKEEFLGLKNVNQLKRMRARVGSSSSRAWFISPNGKVIDCDQSHDACMRDRPEVFGNVRDLMTLIPMGWIRVGNLGYYTFIDCDRMTAKQLDKTQELVAGISHETVEINKKDRRTKMTRGEFLSLNSPGEINRRRAKYLPDQANSKILLSTDCKSLRVDKSPSDAMKELHPEKRSWWVDPQGGIHDAGHDHNKFLAKKPRIFGKWADINKALTMNWVRVAFLQGEYVVHCHNITRAQIAACQEIYKSLGGEYKIYFATLEKGGYVSPHDFIWADSQTDLLKKLFKDPTGIRGSVTASSPSEWMKRQFSDKKSWWIDPYGVVHDAGHNHDKFVKEHPELFGTDEPDYVADFGWVRVGSMGQEFMVSAKSLSEKKLEEVKKLYYETNKPYAIIVVGNLSGRITGDEFLQADSVEKLLKELRRARFSRRQAAGDYERAWLISPQGKEYSCGFRHGECESNKEIFQAAQEIDPEVEEGWDILDTLMNEGWAKVGYFKASGAAYDVGTAYLDGPLTGPIFRKFQEILSSLNISNNTKLTVGPYELLWKDFRFFDSVAEIRKFWRHYGKSGSRRRANESDRAWMVSPKGEWIGCGQNHNEYVNKYPDKFGVQPDLEYPWLTTAKLVKEGWTQVGILENSLYFACMELKKKVLDEVQSLVLKDSSITRVEPIDYSIGNKVLQLSRDEFLQMNKPSELRRIYRASASRRSRRANGSDRAWMVSPQGDWVNCDRDHDYFIKHNPERFGVPTEIEKPSTWLVDRGWAKIGKFTTIIYLECSKLTKKLLDQIQDFVLKDSAIQFVQVVDHSFARGEVLEVERGDFLTMNKPSDLRWMFNIRSSRTASEYTGRAWLVTPQGEVINCGNNHERFVLEKRDIFSKMGYDITSSYPLVKDGWARIGLMMGCLYIECNKLTQKYFDIFQDMITYAHPMEVQVSIGDKVVQFSRQEFLGLENLYEVNRHVLNASRKRSASLPKSRNFLMGVSLDSMPWPLRQAFDLLNLTDKKDKLSANQVVSVFQSNDESLQDHLGRTSTELIRDLNAFFQYGPMKKQIA